MKDRITALLTGLGYTSTEARFYLALLARHPASAAELALSERLPAATAGSVLRRLEQNGIVQRVANGPPRWDPLSTDALVELLRQRPAPGFREFEDSLAALGVSAGNGGVTNVSGYEALIAGARELIARARNTLAISIWCREARALAHDLRAATTRGVHTVLFSFCEVPEVGGHVFSYGLPEPELEEFWRHRLVLVVDGVEALFGGAGREATSLAVRTAHPALVEMALSTVALDVTLLGHRLNRETGAALAPVLGPRLGSLDQLLERNGSR